MVELRLQEFILAKHDSRNTYMFFLNICTLLNSSVCSVTDNTTIHSSSSCLPWKVMEAKNSYSRDAYTIAFCEDYHCNNLRSSNMYTNS